MVFDCFLGEILGSSFPKGIFCARLWDFHLEHAIPHKARSSSGHNGRPVVSEGSTQVASGGFYLYSQSQDPYKELTDIVEHLGTSLGPFCSKILFLPMW